MSKGLKGITVKIDGDNRNLVKTLSSTEKEVRGLSTELKGVNTLLKFDPKNTELLAQKQAILKQAIEQTESKLKTLTLAQKQMSEAGKNADNSAEYRDLQREIAKTEQQIKGYNTQLRNTQKEHKEAKQKAGELKKQLEPLKQTLVAVGNAAAGAAKGGLKALGTTISGTMKAFTAFATTALTAGAAVTKSAVESYADSEQLIGGVETLFGTQGAKSVEEYAKLVGKSTDDVRGEFATLSEVQDTVLQDAKTAYKDAGLSANEYMETVTGFAAALKSGLGEEHVGQMANYANTAVTDMADNANKMGTSMESIQNAYQGFAKQNYTMLDNLKLGYGGTKEEMERLLRDAEEMEGYMEGSLDISNFADIVEAIHIVQENMGIAGTTAKEASETISGSINAAKSAYENLITGLADENADLDGLIDNMTDSALTVVDNVLPRIMEIVPRIIETVPKIVDNLSVAFSNIAGQLGGLPEQILPPLMQAFFTLIKTVTGALPTLLPQILNAALTLFGGLLQGLNDTIPLILDTLPTLIQTLYQTLIANLPQLITAGTQILVNLISGITQAIPSLISAIVELFPVIVQSIMENLPLIIDSGLNLLLSLVTGIVQAIPELIAMLPTIIDTIVTNVVSMLPKIIETGTQLLFSLTNGIIQAIPQLVDTLPQIITSTVNTIIANLPKIIQTGIELLGALISGMIQSVPALVAALPQIFSAIIDTFKGINWADLGKNIIDGVIQGVKNAASSLIDVFTDLAKSALDAVKEFFGIASPSKVMRDQVGKMLPAGMAQGVEEGMDAEEKRIRSAMARGVPTTIDGYIKAGSSRAGLEYAGVDTGVNLTQNLTINSPRELSPSETARLNRNAVRQTILKLRPT